MFTLLNLELVKCKDVLVIKVFTKMKAGLILALK